MDKNKVKFVLNKLGYTINNIKNLELFVQKLIKYNKKHNLISKNTEKIVWKRHILDSAQLIKYINNKKFKNIADFGSGAGFPGLILAFNNNKNNFHVKLYEKSIIKRNFLLDVIREFDLNVTVEGNIYDKIIDANIIVCRAFKKIGEILRISREMIKKPHKLIILKGKNAQNEINKVSLDSNYSYKIEKSLTESDSKIIKKNLP